MGSLKAAEKGGCDEDESWMQLDDNLSSTQTKRVTSVKRGRGKLIMLDDLLKEKERKHNQRVQEEKKKTVLKMGKIWLKRDQDENNISEDEEEFSEEPDEMIKRGKAEEVFNANRQLIEEAESEMRGKWGERIFGPQKTFPELTLPEDYEGMIYRSLGFSAGEGQRSTMESMASSSLLRSWVIFEGRCDEATAHWIFQQMAYSKNVCLEKATCTILCDLLVQEAEDGEPICRFEWLPSFDEIMHTFHTYGYLDNVLDTAGQLEKTDSGSQGETACSEPTASNGRDGPPPNIRSLLKFLVPYIQMRKWYHMLSIPAAESFVVTLVRCQLDRSMLSVSNLLQDCLQTLIYYFTEEEWTSSCERIASSISRISSTLVNNLKVVKCLHATDSRFGSLQRLVVLQLLSRHVEAKTVLLSPQEVVSTFKSVDIKAKACNFMNVYYLLIMADIYLWSESSLKKTKTMGGQLWHELLKKWSTQISTRDLRPYAAKVRNWASFLCQKYQGQEMHAD